MIKLTFKPVLILAALAFAGQPVHATTLFQLLPPSGLISGAPGSTVGWGFSITNTVDYLTVTQSDFCKGAQTQPCTHALGTYTDFIAGNFLVIGPAPESPALTQDFDATLLTGAGSFAINGGAHPGDHADGAIILTYDVYSVSPNDPNFDPFDPNQVVSTGNSVSLDASVLVPGAVPEPGTFVLAGSLLAALAALRFRRLC